MTTIFAPLHGLGTNVTYILEMSAILQKYVDTTFIFYFFLTTMLCRVSTRHWMVLDHTKTLQYCPSSSSFSFKGHHQSVLGSLPGSNLRVQTEGDPNANVPTRCNQCLLLVLSLMYLLTKHSLTYQVYASITERGTGPRIPADFDSSLFETTYRRHIDFFGRPRQTSTN